MPAIKESALSFDVIDDKWFDVLNVDGTTASVTLQEVLRSAHRISRLSEPSPLTEVALLRFLIALVSDGLRVTLQAEGDWAGFADQCQDGLPTEVVAEILAPLRGRSDVLDTSHDSFFDGPSVRRVSGWDDPGASQPVSRFLPELPTGTNLAHFAHISDDSAALCVGCLLKSRAVDAAFARGGLGPSLSRNLLATISGTEPRYVMFEGNTLLETLLLNVVIADRTRPSWVSVHRTMDGDPGPIARMSWRPRLVLPVTSSKSHLACVRCGTTESPRFKKAVMLDVYNSNGSPFGAQEDVARWKIGGGDPQLLSFENSPITFGRSSLEWPLRAITRMLASDAPLVWHRLMKRAVQLRNAVTLSVTSSAGNKAKIDDAPQACVTVPPALLARSPEKRGAISAALIGVFDDDYREQRSHLIPTAVPELLTALAESDDPTKTVMNWLRHQPSPPKIIVEPRTDEAVRKAAQRMIEQLGRLSSDELAALRGSDCNAATDSAARQAAFESVWHRVSVPGGSKRHSLREALAAVAAIYASCSGYHRGATVRGSFVASVRRLLDSERRMPDRKDRVGAFEKLLAQLCEATSTARDDLLLRLVQLVVAEPSNGGRRTIDFADLLLDVADWNAPANPTPARWRQLLKTEDRSAVVVK